MVGRMLLAAAVVSVAQLAMADTFIYGGVQVSLPDEGYVIKTGRMASIVNEEKKLIVEIYRFSKVPEATKERITEIMKPRKNTTDVHVLEAKEVKQYGVKVTSAEGTVKILGTEIHFLLVGIPLNDRAIVAVAYMPQAKENTHRKELETILASFKKKSNEPPKPVDPS